MSTDAARQDRDSGATTKLNVRVMPQPSRFFPQQGAQDASCVSCVASESRHEQSRNRVIKTLYWSHRQQLSAGGERQHQRVPNAVSSRGNQSLLFQSHRSHTNQGHSPRPRRGPAMHISKAKSASLCEIHEPYVVVDAT
ncbi:hypothetical protein E2C01_002413 [Portunus trituberculatus]|uniref:Uncharacterized protein n=1 Tax=Portunus trituberculatus TaxID=210409 RepID=A0A5B7CKI1_PORTR|nr:hypothetical protein [Portunus trituberculatus]